MQVHENAAELVLICSGEADFLIGNKSCRVRPGDLVVYNSGIVHDEMTGPENRISMWGICLGGLCLPGLGENCLTGEGEGYIFSTGEWFDEMSDLFRMIYRNLEDRAGGSEELAHYLMISLIILTRHIVRRGGGRGTPEADVGQMNILGIRAREYIARHFRENISLQMISESMHCSKYYLSHMFKELCGYSPMQYLIRCRIGEAQKLLIGTDLTISRIAREVGYGSQSYFTSQFMKYVGLSPLVYRKKYARSLPEKDT